MSSDKNDHAGGFRNLEKPVQIGGVTYGSGWPVFTIKTPWAAGCPAQDGEAEPDCAGTEEPEKRLLSIEDVANILGISVRAVEQLVRKKKLGCVQLTKRKRGFTRELIDDFVRRESGLSPVIQRNNSKPAPLGERPATKPLPTEEARALLRKVTKKG